MSFPSSLGCLNVTFSSFRREVRARWDAEWDACGDPFSSSSIGWRNGWGKVFPIREKSQGRQSEVGMCKDTGRRGSSAPPGALTGGHNPVLGQGQKCHTATGTASQGSREGMKSAGRGLGLFFSPLPALGRMSPSGGEAVPAVMFSHLRHRGFCCLLRLSAA